MHNKFDKVWLVAMALHGVCGLLEHYKLKTLQAEPKTCLPFGGGADCAVDFANPESACREWVCLRPCASLRPGPPCDRTRRCMEPPPPHTHTHHHHPCRRHALGLPELRQQVAAGKGGASRVPKGQLRRRVCDGTPFTPGPPSELSSFLVPKNMCLRHKLSTEAHDT